jgi:chromosome segregation ATPase
MPEYTDEQIRETTAPALANTNSVAIFNGYVLNSPQKLVNLVATLRTRDAFSVLSSPAERRAVLQHVQEGIQTSRNTLRTLLERAERAESAVSNTQRIQTLFAELLELVPEPEGELDENTAANYLVQQVQQAVNTARNKELEYELLKEQNLALQAELEEKEKSIQYVAQKGLAREQELKENHRRELLEVTEQKRAVEESKEQLEVLAQRTPCPSPNEHQELVTLKKEKAELEVQVTTAKVREQQQEAKIAQLKTGDVEELEKKYKLLLGDHALLKDTATDYQQKARQLQAEKNVLERLKCPDPRQHQEDVPHPPVAAAARPTDPTNSSSGFSSF